MYTDIKKVAIIIIILLLIGFTPAYSFKISECYSTYNYGDFGNNGAQNSTLSILISQTLLRILEILLYSYQIILVIRKIQKKFPKAMLTQLRRNVTPKLVLKEMQVPKYRLVIIALWKRNLIHKWMLKINLPQYKPQMMIQIK